MGWSFSVVIVSVVAQFGCVEATSVSVYLWDVVLYALPGYFSDVLFQ